MRQKDCERKRVWKRDKETTKKQKHWHKHGGGIEVP